MVFSTLRSILSKEKRLIAFFLVNGVFLSSCNSQANRLGGMVGQPSHSTANTLHPDSSLPDAPLCTKGSILEAMQVSDEQTVACLNQCSEEEFAALDLDQLMFKAVEENHLESAKKLLEKQANANQIHTLDGNTLLHIAVKKGSHHMVSLLLDYTTTSINAKNKDGNTPLHIAVKESSMVYPAQAAIIRDLLKSGADPRIKNGTKKMRTILLRQTILI